MQPMPSDAAQRELLAYRVLFAGVAARLHQPDAIEQIRALLGHRAPPLEGGFADQMYREYVALKQGGVVPIQAIASEPAPLGVMVISYAASGDGWLFAPNEWTAEGWRRPGAWSHWGHMVMVPNRGPDGRPVLFEECQHRIASTQLSFRDQDRVVSKHVFYQDAALVMEMFFHLMATQGNEKFLADPDTQALLAEFERCYGISLDPALPYYQRSPQEVLRQLILKWA